MKKVIAFVLAAVMVLALAACGGEKSGVKEVVMADFYEKLAAETDLPDMVQLSEKRMLDFVGVDSEADCKQAVVAICGDSMRTDEVWLIEAKDEAAAKAILELVDVRLQQKGDESISYAPDQYEVVQKAEIVTAGNYIAVFVSPEAAKMASLFKEAAGI